MGSQIIETTFLLKRGSAKRWAEVNPVLKQGEPGFVYDSNQLKIGDGKTPWNELPFIEGATVLKVQIPITNYPLLVILIFFIVWPMKKPYISITPPPDSMNHCLVALVI